MIVPSAPTLVPTLTFLLLSAVGSPDHPAGADTFLCCSTQICLAVIVTVSVSSNGHVLQSSSCTVPTSAFDVTTSGCPETSGLSTVRGLGVITRIYAAQPT